MKSFQTRGVVAIALVTALGIVTPAVAFGATTTTTTAPGTTTTVKATLTNPWQQWRHAQEAYVDQLEVIRHTFHSTVKTARDAFRAAVRASQGSANRAALIAAARAALTLSIANAMGARSTALIATLRRHRPGRPVRPTSSRYRGSMRRTAPRSLQRRQPSASTSPRPPPGLSVPPCAPRSNWPGPTPPWLVPRP
jgi:hypothetical protein